MALGEEIRCQAQPKARRSNVISLLHLHLLSVSDGLETPTTNLSVMSFGNNYFCMLFYSLPPPKKSFSLNLLGQRFGCCWLFQFMLFSSLNPALRRNAWAQELWHTRSLPRPCHRASRWLITAWKALQMLWLRITTGSWFLRSRKMLSAWDLPWIKPPQGLPFKLHKQLRPPRIWLFLCTSTKWRQTF